MRFSILMQILVLSLSMVLQQKLSHLCHCRCFVIDFSMNGVGYDSGLIYSPGWPFGYQKFNSSCNFILEKRSAFQGFYVFFMDASFYVNGYPADCVQVFGMLYACFH